MIWTASRKGTDLERIDTTEPWPDGPFPVRLRTAIERRGLGLQRICAHLRQYDVSCSASTLSLWRNGRTRPRRAEGKKAVEMLEVVLATPPGYLVDADHVPLTGSSEWWTTTSDPAIVLQHGEEFLAAQKDFDIPVASAVKRLGVVDVVQIDENRAWAGSTCTMMLEALDDGVDRILTSTFSSLFTEDSQYMRVSEPQFGARLGRRRVSPTSGQTISEFVFDAPLQKGDITTIEFMVIPVNGPEPPQTTQPCHQLRSASPIGQMTICVDFSPEQLPKRIEQRTSTRMGDPECTKHERRRLALCGNRSVAQGTNMVAGGGVAHFWTWPESEQ